MIFLTSTKVNKKLKKKWIKAIEKSAVILKKSYEIIIHEIKMKNVDIKKQKKAIQKLVKRNEKFHKNLIITRVAWSKSVKKLNKIISSLITETKFSEQINRIIIEKFLKKSKKDAVKFVRKCRITQCFNCYENDHIDKKCKNVTKCDHCAERHDTNRCNKNEIEIIHECVNCEQTKHQIWANMCSIRHKKVERIKRTYDINSVHYSTTVKNLIVVTKQNNKMSVSNEFVSKNFRVQIQISQQYKSSNEKQRTHFIETNEKKSKNKNAKFTKTLKEFFKNRSKAILKNKRLTKKFITKKIKTLTITTTKKNYEWHIQKQSINTVI